MDSRGNLHWNASQFRICVQALTEVLRVRLLCELCEAIGNTIWNADYRTLLLHIVTQLFELISSSLPTPV